MSEIKRALRYGCPAVESIGPNKWERCHDNREILDLLSSGSVDTGMVPTADMAITVNPNNTDTFTLVLNPGPGAITEVYEFLDVLTGAAFEIQRAGNAADSLANAVAVINAQTALPIVASVVGTNLRIQYAEDGVPAVNTAGLDLTLAEGMTPADSVWTQENLGDTVQANKLYRATGALAVTAENLATEFTLPLPFVPMGVFFIVRDAAGLPRPICTSVVTHGADGLTFDLDNGIDPAVATDVVIFEAFGSVLV